MDLGDLLRLLVRRWLIIAIGLALAAGGAAAVYRAAPRSYQADAQGLLLLPPDANNPMLETSPFLYLPQGLNVLGRIVNQRMQTPAFHRQMESEGFHADYELGIETQTPVITITVEGVDDSDTLETRNVLMTKFASILAEVQREEAVPSRQFAHVRFLDTSDEADVVSGDRLRAAAVVGAGGAVLVLLFAIAWDRLARRRSRARSKPEASALSDEGNDPGASTDVSEGGSTALPDAPVGGSTDYQSDVGAAEGETVQQEDTSDTEPTDEVVVPATAESSKLSLGEHERPSREN